MVGLPILAILLYVGFWAVSIVAIAVSVMVGLETCSMVDFQGKRRMPQIVMGSIGGTVTAVGLLVVASREADDVRVIANMIGIVALLFVAGIVLTSRFRHVEVVRRNIVLAYGAAVVMAVTLVPFIASLDKGQVSLTFVILVVFATDTGAYFIGKSIGKHKLAPKISPGKTWEGLIGGVTTAVLISWLLSEIPQLGFSASRSVGIGLAITIVGAIGDLSESWIKRLSGVKDSGSIIPGHGGILDRLDALAPNFMLIYFIERWLG